MGSDRYNAQKEKLDEERIELRIRMALLAGDPRHHDEVLQLRSRIATLNRQITGLRVTA